MPTRAPRVCSCGRIVAYGVQCSCQVRQKAEADKRRPSARQRGYDTAFQREASAFLKDHPTCTCGAPAVLVRHRISIRARPDLRMAKSNWLPGCRRCNARDVVAERRAAGGG
ncbi:MAG: endonuclease [Xanthobacteraceae bacterium]|nr:endonuclease [Xanthobacteraceae bacterium]